jgi:hypothetical protein
VANLGTIYMSRAGVDTRVLKIAFASPADARRQSNTWSSPSRFHAPSTQGPWDRRCEQHGASRYRLQKALRFFASPARSMNWSRSWRNSARQRRRVRHDHDRQSVRS